MISAKIHFNILTTKGVVCFLGGRTMVIFDEEAYATALSDYLNREKENEILSLVFTEESKLKEYLKENEKAYLLINEKYAEDESISELDESRRIFLCETRSGEKTGAWIYKYQSAKLIKKELSAYFYDNEDESKLGMEKIYAVWSALNGLERNEYVKVVQKSLEEEGSVLYLDMEPFPIGRNLEEGYGRGMSELIYYLKKGGKDLKWKIKALICNEGIHGRINPSKCSLDLNEINREDMRLLVKVLKEMAEYERILINVGFYSLAVLELFSNCMNIDVVVSRNTYDREAAEYFVEQMKLLKLKDAERRMQIVEFETGISL